MARSYRPWDPSQSYLLPPSPDEWLPEGHLAYFVLDVIGQLDLAAIEDVIQAKDPRGMRGYDPRLMLSLLIYGYCVGVRSSRKIERATYEDVPFRVISGGVHPDHTRISEFRRVHVGALEDLFLQVLRLCQEAGLVKLGHVALDGTKLQANASKHKAMSHERMRRSERDLVEQIREMLDEAERTDAEEDALYGEARGDEVPEELRRRESRLARIREAKAKLEAEAAAARARDLAEKAEAAERKRSEAPPDQPPRDRHAKGRPGKLANAKQQARDKAHAADAPEPDLAPRDPDTLPFHQVEHKASGEPAPKAQRNFTDPDSRIMKRGDEYLQGYNCQAAVDAEHQVIVAQAVTNQAPDQEHLRPMVKRIEQGCGALPDQMSGDAGYWSEADVAHVEALGVELYIATERHKHNEALPQARGRPPKNLDARGRMRRKLRTKTGRAIYARRKAIVEPVFGQIKEVRTVRRFLLRGIDKARGEWALITLGHNLLKLRLALG